MTFTAVGSAFDRAAQQAARAARKLNNRFEGIYICALYFDFRLLLNDFVHCMSICADFKYARVDQPSRLSKLLNHCLRSKPLQNDLIYVHLCSIFDWISDAQIVYYIVTHSL